MGDTASPRPLMIGVRLLGVDEDLLLLVDRLPIEFSCDNWIGNDCRDDDDADPGLLDGMISLLFSILIVDTTGSFLFTITYGCLPGEVANESEEEEEVEEEENTVGNNGCVCSEKEP